ncbi:hypothetical protein [Arthrobacter sp. PAMC25284]|nr:hypothetical protein [Arthrobacter sp. PAMC25284]
MPEDQVVDLVEGLPTWDLPDDFAITASPEWFSGSSWFVGN